MIVCLLWGITETQAQIRERTDTVFIRKRTFLVLGDTTIFVPRDTVLHLPDSVIRRLRRQRPNSDSLYYRLKQSLYRRELTRKLYDLFFQQPVTKKSALPATPRYYLTYEDAKDRRIAGIRIKKLDVFGTSINDTLSVVQTKMINTANDLHVNTQNSVIRNLLFFRVGDKVDPELLKDSERILRSQSFIRDARIYIEDSGDQDAVQIVVVVKDVWSLIPELDYSSLDRMTVALVDKNIFGTGHELRNEIHYDNRYRPRIGYFGKYTINNIARSFITSEFTLGKTRPYEREGIRFFREFITPEINYGFGAEVAHEREELEYLYSDTTIRFFTTRNFTDLWLGRSIPLRKDDRGRVNFIISGRFFAENYSETPFISLDTNQFFLDKRQYYFSAGVTRRAYEKSRLIRGFGRTEDIPKGYILQLIGAWEDNELYNRTYLGTRLEAGQYISNLGYFRPSLEMGGFRHNEKWEQAVFRFQLNYFSNLYQYHRFKFRQFFNFNYTRGTSRFTNEYININGENGLRGFNDRLLRGTERTGFGLETIAFTPYYIWGFRFAIYFYADLGILNNVSGALLKNKLYQGYGLGFRLRNENLAINTIEVRLGYFPFPPGTSTGFDLDITGRSELDIPDLRIDKPQVLPFR